MGEQKGVDLTLFNYTVRAREILRRTARNIIELSQIAGDIREKYGYERYLSWVKDDLGLSARMGDNLLAVFKQFGSTANFAVSENIAPSALYLLASPSIPEQAREEALTRARSGEGITHSGARQIVDSHVLSNLIPEIAGLLESGRISRSAAAQFSRMDSDTQYALYGQILAIDSEYQGQLEIRESEAKRIRDEYARQQETISSLEARIDSLQQMIPTQPVLSEINRLKAELESERSKPPRIEIRTEAPPDYEELKRNVERLQRKIDSAKGESTVKEETIQRLTKNLEKARLELSHYDYKRKEMNAIHYLDEAHKLIGKAGVQLEDPRGGAVMSERIEGLIAAIQRELQKLTPTHITIDVSEVR